ncbi:MAG: flagellar basal body P-ring protein FlgI, partial [Planctomycetota bacterium]
ALAACWCAAVVEESADARTILRNICRVKGQEENELKGLGLVVGLSGTGAAGDPATMRALARAMELMGSPLPQATLGGEGGLEDLAKIKNVSLAWVSARVPATGARRGDRLDCVVSAINGKSLAGGRLAFAALQGPNTQDRRVFALCEGGIHIEDAALPTVGRVHQGCQMEEEVFTPFVKDGRITLVLEKNHANFQTARDVVELIRSTFSRGEERDLVQAVNAANIVVTIPAEYQKDPVAFAADILEIQVYAPDPEARVVINERAGTIVISGDVTIGDVVVSTDNVVVETGQRVEFRAVESDASDPAKLQSLVQALNALQTPNEDLVAIIKSIERNGKLHGRLIIE